MRGEGRRTLDLRASILNIMGDEINPEKMSARQVAYLCVGCGAITGTEAEKESVGRLLVKMREDGSVDYERIVDRTRAKHQSRGWAGVSDIMEAAASSYRRNLWSNQETIPMIACEKQALEGIFGNIVDEYGASLWTIHGFNSVSFDYEWAKEIRRITAEGKRVTVIYFGDHDPPGLDIEINSRNKLEKFGAVCSWKRAGLLLEDFDRFDLVRVPVKMGYHGAKSFLTKFGDRSAELDALRPAELESRIRNAIEEHIDQKKWRRLQDVEAAEKRSLQLVTSNWGVALEAAGGAA